MYAEKKNQVLLRVQNMEDSFDKDPETYKFDVNFFAENLFLEANPGFDYSQIKVDIEEMTLSGVTNYEKRMSEDFSWTTNEKSVMIQRPQDQISVSQDG